MPLNHSSPLISALFTSMFSMTALAAQTVPFAEQAPRIDGQQEALWDTSEWHPLNQHIVGSAPEADDFQGRYKLMWNAEHLYILAEITDDILFDQHADPLYKYWDDDCLEIFIDEDRSGGNHQTNFNAFAYHIALDNQAVDIGPNYADGNTQFILLNQHVESHWQRQAQTPHKVIWEVALQIHNDNFSLQQASEASSRVSLQANKEMGFMLAYCDNDSSEEREHFMGSHKIKPVNGDKNLGYITADVFGEINLEAPKKHP